MKKTTIEARAKAAYEASNTKGGLQMPWAAQSEKVRERWRQAVSESTDEPQPKKKSKSA